MTSLRTRIDEILNDTPATLDWRETAAARILAAVADHPGKADCPVCHKARWSLPDFESVVCVGCGKRHVRAPFEGVNREPVQSVADAKPSRPTEAQVRAANGLPEHPDTVALRELRAAIEASFPDQRIGSPHAYETLLRAAREMRRLVANNAEMGARLLSQPSPPRQTIREANGAEPGERTRELIDSELKRVRRCAEVARESQLIDDVCEALASLRRAVVMIEGERRRELAQALDERGGQ
jgi:hypothetical protein